MRLGHAASYCITPFILINKSEPGVGLAEEPHQVKHIALNICPSIPLKIYNQLGWIPNVPFLVT
jgi:hypothetical protein